MEEGRSSKAGQLFVGLHAEISVRVVPKSKKELKTAGDKNKNAIWALLLLLALTTTFLQNYHNNQVLVTPNEMVGLLPSVTTKLPAAIFFSGLSLVLGSS